MTAKSYHSLVFLYDQRLLSGFGYLSSSGLVLLGWLTLSGLYLSSELYILSGNSKE
jgi:hypothetical protein